MEDVLSVYQRPVSESEPLVCMDETSKQHVKETRLPLPCRTGDVEKYDYEYERNGVSNLFVVSAPLIGWRHVPNAKRVVMAMDNLNTLWLPKTSYLLTRLTFFPSLPYGPGMNTVALPVLCTLIGLFQSRARLHL